MGVQKKMKTVLRIFVVMSVLIIVIPCGILIKNGDKASAVRSVTAPINSADKVVILSCDSGKLSEVSLDEYLAGCVMAQMPCDFESEALKAQAVICRTYIFARKLSFDKSLNGADVSDSGEYQDYFTSDEAKIFYGKAYEQAYSKALSAVKETDGIYISYNGRPAVTAFHPLSAGKTESAEEIWGISLPYLVSAKSESDREIEGFSQNVKISATELFSRLCAFLEIDADTEAISGCRLEISEKTENGTVLSLGFTINGEKKEVAARDFASILGLNSCNFDFVFVNDTCTITCRGCGHLVGLSQWGANSMAMSGSDFREILSHYFYGISFEKQE